MQQRNAGALRLRLENELKHAPQTEGATEDLYAVAKVVEHLTIRRYVGTRGGLARTS